MIVIVLRLGPVAGPVQSPGSGFWPGHQVGQVSFFFLKKSKRRRFSKTKNKKKTKVNEFATGSC